MADRPKEGDPVLWYGHKLAVTGIEERGDVEVAVVEQVEALRQRDEARTEILDLRMKQESGELAGGDHKRADARIKELVEQYSGGLVRAKLRLDLLSWWEERGVWVSDGRILNDDQIEQFQKLTGSKPRPDGQRQALVLLEKLNADTEV